MQLKHSPQQLHQQHQPHPRHGFRPFATGLPARPCTVSVASAEQRLAASAAPLGRRGRHATKAAHPDRAYFSQQQQQAQGSSVNKPDLAQPLMFSDAAGGQVPPTPDLLAEVLPLLTPKQLADAIWGFAKQGSRPAQDVMDAIAAEVLSKLEHFKSPDLSNTIWALAVLKYQPSGQWWDAFERQVYQHLCDFSDREAANLMWSLAVLDHRPCWVLEPLLTAAQDQLHAYSPNALHLMGWSCGKLGYCPSREWLSGYLKAAQASFFQFSPAEMSNIIWALAKLVPGSANGSAQQQQQPGASPSSAYRVPALWLDNFLMVTQWRFPSFSAKTLSVVAWAVASLGHTPSQEWLVLYEQQVREKFWDFNGQELACIAWALRRFGATPEHNAVFYMLERQEGFLEVDFEILSNSKLLGQVHQWRHEAGASASSAASSAPILSSGGGGDAPGSSTTGGARESRHSTSAPSSADAGSAPSPMPPPQGAGAPPAANTSQPQAFPRRQEQEPQPPQAHLRPAADGAAPLAQGTPLDSTTVGAGDVSSIPAPRQCAGEQPPPQQQQHEQGVEGGALPPA